ncbi:MAG: 50S ribosomal protein L11 methyltransferase [Pseudomonadota bacterium]|nr:50S ribosomal protein L11 methyltransferase [Pseudomonadota bacterium]
MKSSRLWTVGLTTAPAYAEALADNLAELPGPEPLALSILSPPRAAVAHVEAIYGDEPDRAALTAGLALHAASGLFEMPKIDIRQMPDLNWLKKVSADFPPLPIASWIVHGAEHAHAVPDRRKALQIDATSAFGTGEHPTTRGCLLMLDWVLKHHGKPARVLDMGCGSGILALAYVKSAQGRAVAVDNHADSVAIARENARINGRRMQLRAKLGRGYAVDEVKKNAPFDLIMANIFARPLASMARDLRLNLAPGGLVILSGFLRHQVNLVLAAHRMQKLYLLRMFHSGDWVVLVLSRR